LRSTSSPRRASEYKRRPCCLSAEYIGGTCSISPRYCASTRAISSAARAGAAARATIAPSASPVSVATPKVAVTRYDLRAPSNGPRPWSRSQAHRQHARRQWIEAACVPGFLGRKQALHALQHAVRARAARLVEEHDASNLAAE
jgi:hypothetical protein